MFTNLDFLDIGRQWTPNNAAFNERQTNYKEGRELYEGHFKTVYGKVWAKIATRYGVNLNDIEQVMIKINLFRSLTETFKILAFQKEPDIWVGEGDNAQRLEEYYPRQKALTFLKKAFISAHAQGESVFKVYTNSDGLPDISVVNPEDWIPVYNPENLDEVVCHVVANKYEVNNVTNMFGLTRNQTENYLNVEIHYKGSYEKRLYALDNQDIIQRLLKTETIQTGYDDFTVFPFNYGTPAWRDYGLSAYVDLIPIIDEMVVRLSNNSKILDDHADPQLVVPKEMVEYDQNTGEWIYKRHNAAVYGKNGEKPEYLTWDGNLTSSENQLNRVLDLFYMISGTNPQLFGRDIAGNLSGEALAKILIVPVAKTKEMILSLEDAAEKALNCMLSLRGVKETADIAFEIGQFNSAEDVTNRVVAEKNAGITSLYRAVSEINPRYTAGEIDEEVNSIREDESAGADLYGFDNNQELNSQKDNIEDEEQ